MSQEHYSADDLVEPFYFNRATPASDSQGGYTTTVARNPATGFHFAKVRPLRGTERVVNDGLSAVSEVMFVVYSDLGIRATDVLVYKDILYNIRRVNVPGNSVFQELEAEAGVVNG